MHSHKFNAVQRVRFNIVLHVFIRAPLFLCFCQGRFNHRVNILFCEKQFQDGGQALVNPIRNRRVFQRAGPAPKLPFCLRNQIEKDMIQKGFFTALRRWLIDNELEIWRHDQPVTALPVLILLLLLICAFWVAISVLLLGLFLGFRYRFSGPDLEREDLNNMIGSVADTAADLGRQVMDELKHDWHSDEKDKK